MIPEDFQLLFVVNVFQVRWNELNDETSKWSFNFIWHVSFPQFIEFDAKPFLLVSYSVRNEGMEKFIVRNLDTVGSGLVSARDLDLD